MTETADSAVPALTTGEPIRVLVVDDHALFRRGLEMVLEQEPDIDVVGEAEETTLDGASPIVIRTKDHEARPMSLEQALYEMELVGHDFYLFVDAGSGRPSVVYRRRGWSYGVIRLKADSAAEIALPSAGAADGLSRSATV